MRDKKGYYDIPDLGPSVKFASVTTIQGILDRHLDNWKAGEDVDYLYNNSVGPFLAGDMTIEQFKEIDFPKLVADAKLYHKDVSNEAMDFGSRFHKAMDDYHTGREGGCEIDLADCVKATIEWEELVNLRVIESEGVVYSKAFQFAGTRDLKCEITLNKEPLVGIIDFKTRNGKDGKAVPVYPTDREQVAAYCLADEEMSGSLLDFGGVVIINRETSECHPHIYTRAQLIGPGMDFINLARYFNGTKRKVK